MLVADEYFFVSESATKLVRVARCDAVLIAGRLEANGPFGEYSRDLAVFSHVLNGETRKDMAYEQADTRIVVSTSKIRRFDAVSSAVRPRLGVISYAKVDPRTTPPWPEVPIGIDYGYSRPTRRLCGCPEMASTFRNPKG